MEISEDGLHGFERGSLQRVFGPHLFESSDDIADLAFQQHLHSLTDPRLGLGAAFGVKDVGPFPQILHDMPQIQNSDGFGQVALLQFAQDSLSVTEKDHRLGHGALPLMGLLSQRLKQAVLVIQQFGLDSFMIGARSLGRRGVPRHLIQDLFGRALKRLDAIDGPDTGHLLFRSLFSFFRRVPCLDGVPFSRARGIPLQSTVATRNAASSDALGRGCCFR